MHSRRLLSAWLLASFLIAALPFSIRAQQGVRKIQPNDLLIIRVLGEIDMTKEADDTSLGAGLLEDVYGGETMAQTAADMPSGGGFGGGEAGGAGLFETPGAEIAEPTGAGVGMAMAFAEPYDGPGSGWVGGLALGVVLVCGLAVFAAVVGLAGGSGTGMLSNLVGTLGEQIFIILGAAAGVCVLFAGVGFILGKKS